MAKAEYRSAIRSRKLIQAALADLLQEKPLEKITVTDVVDRAQINRGTFYAHYTDIRDVINRLVEQTFSNIRHVLTENAGSLATLSTALPKSIRQLLEEDLEFYQKLMTSSAAAAMKQLLMDMVLEYLFQHESDFHFGNHEQYCLTVCLCAGGLANMYLDWFAGKLPCSLDELTQQTERLLSSILL